MKKTAQFAALERKYNQAPQARMEVPKSKDEERGYPPSRIQMAQYKRSFLAGENSRLADGWTTNGASIDHFLRQQLPVMQARSSEQCYNNPMAIRYVRLMKRNVSGAKGVIVKPKAMFNGVVDEVANKAIEKSMADWAEYHCDFHGKLTLPQIEKLLIGTMIRCGEYIVIEHNTGKYGYQLEVIDPELLDVTRNMIEANGNTTRMGVERNRQGTIVRYWFRELDHLGNFAFGTFGTGRNYSISAKAVIHGFETEYPSQSRGIPRMYSALVKMKMLAGFDEAALVAARAGASKMGFIKEDLDKVREEDEFGNQISEFESGSIERIDHEDDFIAFDPKYPHEFYAPFTKKHQRDVSMGFDLSYASMTGDLSDTNYSSIRWGGLDERDAYEEQQELFISSFRRPIHRKFIINATLRGLIKTERGISLSRPVDEYYPAMIRGRRWPWVDPAKEINAAEKAVMLKVKSRAQIIRDRGDDPEETWDEIDSEIERFGEYNPNPQTPLASPEPKDTDSPVDNEEEDED